MKSTQTFVLGLSLLIVSCLMYYWSTQALVQPLPTLFLPPALFLFTPTFLTPSQANQLISLVGVLTGLGILIYWARNRASVRLPERG